jgi:two-component system nitrogen regulation sensor histidine kinase GlnL
MPLEPAPEMRRLLENMATAVILVRDDLCVEFMNPAAEMLLEVSAQRANGAPLSELMRDTGGCEGAVRQAIRDYHPISERERELALHSDRVVTVDCMVTPIIEPGAQDQALLELVPIDRALRISREEQLISQQMATQALLRGLAHEVKNPLGGLRGAAQLLERELAHEELKEYTRIIIGEADRLRNLVNRMLGPKRAPEKTLINLHEITEHIRQLIEVDCPTGVSVLTDYDPSIPQVTADRDQIIQVVLNIARNAVQAVGDAGNVQLRTRVERQFTIGHTRHRLVAVVEVFDDGPGIPKDLQSQIFYPMVSGRPEGTGLGLSIAQSIVNQHGGIIELRSRPGETVFRVLIPLEPVDEH